MCRMQVNKFCNVFYAESEKKNGGIIYQIWDTGYGMDGRIYTAYMESKNDFINFLTWRMER